MRTYTNYKNAEYKKLKKDIEKWNFDLKNELFLKDSDLKNIKINNDELQKKIFE